MNTSYIPSIPILVTATTPCPTCRNSQIECIISVVNGVRYMLLAKCTACEYIAVKMYDTNPSKGWMGTAVLGEIANEVWTEHIRDLHFFTQ